MTTKKKRIANTPPRPQMGGMITPPEIVAELVVRRTIGDNEHFNRCSHAMQMLPNGVILLLVTSENIDGGIEVDTFIIGEEVPGFKALKLTTETSDDTA